MEVKKSDKKLLDFLKFVVPQGDFRTILKDNWKDLI
jgi:hypothetical protein